MACSGKSYDSIRYFDDRGIDIDGDLSANFHAVQKRQGYVFQCRNKEELLNDYSEKNPALYVLIETCTEDPSGKRRLYVGQTKEIDVRNSAHMKDKRYNKVLWFSQPSGYLSTNDMVFLERGMMALVKGYETGSYIAENKSTASAPSHTQESPQRLNPLQMLGIVETMHHFLTVQLDEQSIPWKGDNALHAIIGDKEQAAKLFEEYEKPFSVYNARYLMRLESHKQGADTEKEFFKVVKQRNVLFILCVALAAVILCLL